MADRLSSFTSQSQPSQTSARGFGRARKAGWIALALLLAAAAGYGVLAWGLRAFLTSNLLREKIAQKTGAGLHADAGFLPVRVEGLTLFSDGLFAQGRPPSSLTVLEARGLTARCSLRSLWRRVWSVDELHVEQLQAAYGPAAQDRFYRAALAARPTTQPQNDAPSPIHVAIRKTVVERGDLSWGKSADVLGFVQGIKAVCTTTGPGNQELDVQGQSGRFQQAKWPEFKIGSFRLHYAKPLLRLEHSDFRQPEENGGSITVDGQVKFAGATPLDLSLVANLCQVAPFLPAASHDKLEGIFGGRVTLHKELASQQTVRAAGNLDMTQCVLQGLDALDTVATITHKPEFKHLHVQEVRTQFVFDQGKLQATALHAEARGLVRLDGEFTLDKEQISGSFELGAAASVLAPIPGAREKVFTEAHGGYLWTTVKVTGSLDHPQEDLKARLIKAAQGQIVGTVVAPVLKPGEGILELLKQL